jgi:hypothetical protein
LTVIPWRECSRAIVLENGDEAALAGRVDRLARRADAGGVGRDVDDAALVEQGAIQARGARKSVSSSVKTGAPAATSVRVAGAIRAWNRGNHHRWRGLPAEGIQTDGHRDLTPSGRGIRRNLSGGRFGHPSVQYDAQHFTFPVAPGSDLSRAKTTQ